MTYYVLVRGPLASGKTTVSRRLAAMLGAEHISIDRILDDEGFWVMGRLREFLRANEVAARRARRFLAQGTPVIFDGNFYWKTQIADLIGRLDFLHAVFTLQVPLEECIRRDSRRRPPHGSQAARAVYAKSTRFEYGTRIDATSSVDLVTSRIVSLLRGSPGGRGLTARRVGPDSAGPFNRR